MSDLTATNCGCGCDNNCDNGCGNGRSIFGGDCGCTILWLLILASLFNNNGFGGCDGDNNSCCWIILLLLFCGNGNGFNLGLSLIHI